MQQAEEKAAKAWGVGPLGKPGAPADFEKEVMERINQGDTRAAFASIVGEEYPF
jgi:hypothetical protein